MQNIIRISCFIFLFTFNISCFEYKSTEKEIHKSRLLSTSKTDTLTFTSGIRAIFQDSKGNYWFGSHNEGISYFDGKSYTYFTSLDGLFDNQIRSIQEDKYGYIWFGTAKGVSVYANGSFISYSSYFNKQTSYWNETFGDLWFSAGEKEGVYRFDGINMNYLMFPKPKDKYPDNTYGVTGISKDKNGTMWIATYAALFNYDGQTVNIFDHKKLKRKDNELLHIRSVLADSKGRIWIGNNGIGVLLMEGDSVFNFSEKHNLIHPTSTKKGDISKLGTLEHVFAIEEDSEGNIWFGDRDTGAWKYDGKVVTNYTIDNKLSDPMIWTIYKDKNSRLLFGMADGNVYSFNGKTFNKKF
jgi:streptogramin lyase